MLCTASVLIQGKLKCFIASIKDITVLGAMGQQANTSRFTFLWQYLCVKIKASPLLEATFSEMPLLVTLFLKNELQTKPVSAPTAFP